MKKLFLIVAVSFIGVAILSTSSFAERKGWDQYQQKEWATFQLYNPYQMEYKETTKYKKNPPYTIAYADCAISNIWSVFTSREYMAEAARQEAKGVVKKFYHTDAQDKPDKQIADIEDLMVKGIDLLITRPATEAALDPIITRVYNQGIPVICVSRRIKSNNFCTHVVTSNYASARLQMTWLCQMLKGKGNVILLFGKAGSSTAEERKRGAKEAIFHYPDIKVLDEQYTDWSPAKGKQIMKAMIQSYGKKINGVYADYGQAALGPIEAMQEAGMKVPITGDTLNGFMKRVQKWGFPAMVIASSPMMGGASVKIAMRILQGIPVPFSSEEKGIVITTHDTIDVKSEMPWKEFVKMDKPDEFYPDNNLEDKIGKKYMP